MMRSGRDGTSLQHIHHGLTWLHLEKCEQTGRMLTKFAGRKDINSPWWGVARPAPPSSTSTVAWWDLTWKQIEQTGRSCNLLASWNGGVTFVCIVKWRCDILFASWSGGDVFYKDCEAYIGATNWTQQSIHRLLSACVSVSYMDFDCMCQCVIHCLWVHVSVCHTLPLSACVSVSYIAFKCMCQCVIHHLRSHVPLCHTLHLSACVSVSYIAFECMCQCVIHCHWVHVSVCHTSPLSACVSVSYIALDHMCHCVIHCIWVHVSVCHTLP